MAKSAKSKIAEKLAALRSHRDHGNGMADPLGSLDAAGAVPGPVPVKATPAAGSKQAAPAKVTPMEKDAPEGLEYQIPEPMGEAEAKALAAELGLPEPRDIGLGMWGVCCFVMPETAEAWMADRNKKNRNQTDGQIDRLSADIGEGNWRLIHQGIGFRRDGQLQDGQHRLGAIMLSGVPCAILVVLNVDDEARMAIDGTLKRQAHHVAAMNGLPWAQTQISAVKRAGLGIEVGTRTPWSNVHVVDLAEKHAEALIWLYSNRRFHIGGRMASVSAVVAACLRAYYNVDRDRLDEFISILMYGSKRDGTLGPEDDGARILANWIANESGRINTRALADSADIYARATSAIRAFMARSRTSRLYAIDREIYTLPE